jgi:formylglycine-generating enzyme required for sulfatase activity/tRNA A-37 threonylcarbamoyl transferase component Bud32
MTDATSGKRAESQASGEDAELDDLLRAVAHAPPRRPPPELARVGVCWAGRYSIEQRLGSGGMGTVYSASDALLKRTVALKVLDAGAGDDAVHKSRLLREARIAAGIEHERVARIYDVGEHEGVLFVAMELVRGETLRKWMTGRVVSQGEILTVAQQIAEGLSALHAAGVFHRDLKPENVMVTEKRGIRLLDFGLARLTTRADAQEEGGSFTGVLEGGNSSAYAGTPGYMAPEQCAGDTLDARVDIFALGVILYELVTGARPFPGAQHSDVLAATLRGAPDFAADAWRHAPPGLLALTVRMLARDPAQRLATGAEVLDALHAIAAESVQPIGLPPPAVTQQLGAAATVPAPTAAPRRWLRTWIALGAAVAIGGGGLLAARMPAIAPLAPRPRALPGMAWIDVGTIMVGRSSADLDRECAAIGPGCDRKAMAREEPSVRVTVPPFQLDVYEVTNEEMAAVLQSLNGSLYVVEDEDDHYPRYVHWNKDLGHGAEILADLAPPGSGIEYRSDRTFHARAGRERWPAVQVTWFAARLFCTTHGSSLPTEDEWEAAARGRDDRPYPWGKAEVRCGEVVVPRDGLIRMPPECPQEVSLGPVGQAVQDVTPEGIHDLGGNAAEWVDAVFVLGSRAGRAEAANLPKVLRGGSFADSFMARTSGRNRHIAEGVGDNLGFRCAVR